MILQPALSRLLKGENTTTLSPGLQTVIIATIIASVLAYAAKKQINEGEIQVFCKGGNLAVDFRREGDKFTNVMLNA